MPQENQGLKYQARDLRLPTQGSNNMGSLYGEKTLGTGVEAESKWVVTKKKREFPVGSPWAQKNLTKNILQYSLLHKVSLTQPFCWDFLHIHSLN